METTDITKSIIKKIEKESHDYFKANKAADDWIAIPKHLLTQVLIDEITKIKNNNIK